MWDVCSIRRRRRYSRIGPGIVLIRKSRHLENADRHTRRDENDKAVGQTEQQRRQ